MKVILVHGDCMERVKEIPTGTIEAVLCDPPYELMDKRRAGIYTARKWDSTGIAFNPNFWRQVYRVLASTGVVKAFSGTRTYHKVAQAMEDVGLTIDLEGWSYNGFPNGNLDVSKAVEAQIRYGSCTPEDQANLADEGHREIVGYRSSVDYQGTAFEKWAPTVSRHEKVPISIPGTEEGWRWYGWGTVLKPAWEPVLIGRKP